MDVSIFLLSLSIITKGFYFFPLVTVSKVLITTGRNEDGKQRSSEVLDLTIKGSNECKNWPVYPITGVDGATGGVIGESVLICGGVSDVSNQGSYIDECFSLNRKSVKHATYMSVPRVRAASIVIDDTTLWVTGGSTFNENGPAILASTEFITMVGQILGRV